MATAELKKVSDREALFIHAYRIRDYLLDLERHRLIIDALGDQPDEEEPSQASEAFAALMVGTNPRANEWQEATTSAYGDLIRTALEMEPVLTVICQDLETVADNIRYQGTRQARTSLLEIAITAAIALSVMIVGIGFYKRHNRATSQVIQGGWIPGPNEPRANLAAPGRTS